MTLRRTLCAVLLLATLPMAHRAAAADRFYSDLLSRGSLAYANGEYAESARLLRTACFGFLEEPPLLLDGLVRLSLAHSALGDIDAFREDFRRIAELERMFGTYSTAALPADLRAAFEAEAAARIPSAELQALPITVSGPEEIEPDLSGLPLRQRRTELRRRATSDAEDIRWPLALAELESEAGRHREALGWLDWLEELDPRNERGLCLRGWNLAETGECPAALGLLEQCAASLDDVRFATPRLQCLVKARNWEAATELAAAHPAEFRTNSPYARWLGRLERNAGAVTQAAATEPAAEPADDAASAPAEPEVRIGVLDGADPLTDGERQTLATIRERLAAAQFESDLVEAETLVEELAQVHPGVQEVRFLAGEVAYGRSNWARVIAHLEAVDESRPNLLFYLAVARYETGDRDGAGRALSRALPYLAKTTFVADWEERIKGSSGNSE